MNPLATLLCGELPSQGRLAQCLAHLSTTLVTLQQGLPLPPSSTLSDRLVRPFLIRSMLEVGCTILIGRVDSFRLLSVAHLQSQTEYDPSMKVAAAIQWTGDILPPNGKVKEKWGQSKLASDMTRALLGDYIDELILRPAFEQFLDYFAQHPPDSCGPWTESLRNIDPCGLADYLRARGRSLHTTTSKGVHHEFVLSPSKYYDILTLEETAQQMLQFLGILGMIVNFADVALFRLSPQLAMACFEDLQRE